MTAKEVKKVVADFGQCVELIHGTNFGLYFLGLKYPESLLPYKKEKIKKALKLAKVYFPDEKEYLDAVDMIESQIDDFIDDYESFVENQKVLSKIAKEDIDKLKK